MLPEAEGPIARAEAQIRAGARARQIFDRIKGLPRDPRCEFLVTVIDRVEEYASEEYRLRMQGAKFFYISRGAIFTTEDRSQPIFEIADAAMRKMDKINGVEEEDLCRVVQLVSTYATDGIEPVPLDISVENRVGGSWGYYQAIRIIKPDLDEAGVTSALDFVTQSRFPRSTAIIPDHPPDPFGETIWDGFPGLDSPDTPQQS